LVGEPDLGAGFPLELGDCEFMIRSLREAVLNNTSPSSNTDATPDELERDKSGALVTTISSQAEAVGKFVGDCISTPIVQAGTLLSVLSYMLYTEPRLRAVVLFIAVPQLFVVPMIQRRLNVYVRERSHTLVRAGDLMVDPTLRQGSSAASSRFRHAGDHGVQGDHARSGGVVRKLTVRVTGQAFLPQPLKRRGYGEFT